MKFMPQSSATRTVRSASLISTLRNSCPSEEAPKLRTGSFRPVLPSGRVFIEIRNPKLEIRNKSEIQKQETLGTRTTFTAPKDGAKNLHQFGCLLSKRGTQIVQLSWRRVQQTQ